MLRKCSSLPYGQHTCQQAYQASTLAVSPSAAAGHCQLTVTGFKPESVDCSTGLYLAHYWFSCLHPLWCSATKPVLPPWDMNFLMC